jgi:hypothetical protein
MTGTRVWALFRLVMAVGTLWALLVQFGKVDADPELTVGGFLSLFTNESNFLAALSLIVGGIWLWRGQGSPDWFDFARGALVTWLALTGIVFLVLLADPELRFKYHINEPSDQLHKAMPLFLLVDCAAAGVLRILADPGPLGGLVSIRLPGPARAGRLWGRLALRFGHGGGVPAVQRPRGVARQHHAGPTSGER